LDDLLRDGAGPEPAARVDRIVRLDVAIPLAAAIVFSWSGLLFTVKAAPIMLGIAGINDPAALQTAFDGFRFWGIIRGAFQIFQFAALMRMLAKT
jgi:hypothetical protein